MTSKEIRQKFIDFFKEKGHKHLPSSSLIPDDPSVLLTTAGMQQFKDWFSGELEPKYPRIVTIQKCLRTSDIEEVGDGKHLTFFEMLGNFSFGDPEKSRQGGDIEAGYYKKEAISWAIEFIKSLEISLRRIHFSTFGGEENIPEDKEAYLILKKLGIPDKKIKHLGVEDNFWGPTGEEGPCGPTVEIYLDGMEVWNLVFNEYLKEKSGNLIPLAQKGVDTGMGLERFLAMANNKKSVYETDLFEPIIKKIKRISNLKEFPREKEKALAIISDHLKGAIFLLADDITPSNLGRGYVLRRLQRRAIRYGKFIGIDQIFCSKIAKIVIDLYQEFYPELKKKKEKIFEELDKEEIRFRKTLALGLKKFNRLIKKEKKLSGKLVFNLFATYGFPLELTKELAQEKGIKIDEKGFWKEFKKHQEISRAGLEKQFKGGLVEKTNETIKLHTATHLLQAALRQVLGNHVKQAGSNITPERLRFDFSHPVKLTDEKIRKVENLVNKKIKENLKIKSEEITYDEAIKLGALAVYSKENYPSRVKVYSIGNFSKEVCGGPHVENTSKLGHFKIIKEEASAAGVRRLKAILLENDQ